MESWQDLTDPVAARFAALGQLKFKNGYNHDELTPISWDITPMIPCPSYCPHLPPRWDSLGSGKLGVPWYTYLQAMFEGSCYKLLKLCHVYISIVYHIYIYINMCMYIYMYMHSYIYTYIHACFLWFPEMEVPLNHPKIHYFSTETHGFGDLPT